MIYGYARVSSKGQERDGNSLEAQQSALLARGCDKIYSEAWTGTTTHRPVFSDLISRLCAGDTLMVTKLDRFSRTAAEGAMLVKALQEKGVIIEILNMGRADSTPMGRLMVTMLLAFAEFEHDNIVERLNVGKEIARMHGKKTDGRYRKDPVDFPKFRKKQKEGSITVDEACAELKISRSTWYARCREEDRQAQAR